MKKKILGLLLAVSMVVTLLPGGFESLAVDEPVYNSTENMTVVDFEDEFTIGGIEENATVDTVGTCASDLIPTKHANVYSEQSSWRPLYNVEQDSTGNHYLSYGADVNNYDKFGLAGAYFSDWNYDYRPTSVSFDVDISEWTRNKDATVTFYPLMNAKGMAEAHEGFKNTLNYHFQQALIMQMYEKDGSFKVHMSRFTDVASDKTFINTDLAFCRVGTDTDIKRHEGVFSKTNVFDSESKKLQVKFDYDWSNYDSQTANGDQLTSPKNVKVTMTIILDGEEIIAEDSYPMTAAYDYQSGFNFGFGTGGFKGRFDNFKISSQKVNMTTGNGLNIFCVPEETAPEMVAKGYTMAIPDSGNKVNLRFDFDFQSIKEAIEGQGETITRFGALVVAGTQGAETMRAQLNTALDGMVPTGYVLLSNDPADIATGVPDSYAVTIGNSGALENMGKRATAIAYIQTDKALYVTNNNNSAKGIVDGVLNKSVMGILKDTFLEKYLAQHDDEVTAGTPADKTVLGKLLASYNTENQTSYTIENLRGIASAVTISTDAERMLLRDLHLALCISD